jgi:hypothetical protein
MVGPPQTKRLAIAWIGALVLAWIFWLVVLRASTLAPWQVVVLPAALLGFAVGWAADGWSKGTVLLLVIGAVIIAVLGDWEQYAFQTRQAVQQAFARDQASTSESSLIAAAAEHARKRAQASGERVDPPQTAPIRPPRTREAVRMPFATLAELYAGALPGRLGPMAVSAVLALLIALQATRMRFGVHRKRG